MNYRRARPTRTNRFMRILIVSETTGYMRGGVPAATRQLINGLTAGGHTVGFCGDIPLPGAVQTKHFPIFLPVDARLSSDVRDATLEFKPDVVHVISISSPGVLRLRNPLRALPWVMTCHSIPPYERKISGLHGVEAAHYGARAIRYFPHAMAWRWLLHRGAVPHVVVHSPWVHNLVVGYGQSANKTTLIPLGSTANREERDIANHGAMRASPKLLTIGGIAHTKGLHDAVRAVGILRKRFPGLVYQIIGEVRDVTYLRFLHSLIGQLKLEKSVAITPALSEEEKNDALRSADLYVQPSHEEGFCLAYIEAARVVPRLVGTSTGAIGLISEDDPGARVVPPRRPVQLAESIAALLTEALPEGLMRQRSERLNARFGWNRYVESHERLYRDLLASADRS